jgi:hypothetical protein
VAAYLTGGKKRFIGKSEKTVDKTRFDDLAQAVTSAGGAVGNKLPGLYKA